MKLTGLWAERMLLNWQGTFVWAMAHKCPSIFCTIPHMDTCFSVASLYTFMQALGLVWMFLVVLLAVLSVRIVSSAVEVPDGSLPGYSQRPLRTVGLCYVYYSIIRLLYLFSGSMWTVTWELYHDFPTLRRMLLGASSATEAKRGYVVIPPCGTPQLHGQIYSKAWAVHAQDATWKLGDGVLGAIPELYQVLEAPKVKQTLSKVLGENYMLHGHRHLHVSSSNNQMWHKDSYWGFRKVRRHRPRWCMLLYYPQDTTVTMGPTCILSGSQYWTKDTEQSEVGEDILLPNSQEQSMFLPQGSLQHQAAVMNEAKSNYLGHHAHLVEDLALTVPAGSCVLMHYDLFHRASCRQSGTAPERFLVKFQFLRTMEPLPRPKPPASFRSGLVAVNPMDPVVEEVRSWLGEAVPAALASGNDVEALNSTNEADRLAAAYRLGRSGCHVPLLAALDEAEAGARAASYGLAAGLSALGAGALATEQRVLQLLKSPSTRTRRFSAFVLGEGAMPSMANVSALGAALREESAASLVGDDTRSEMLEALGLLGARARALGREELCTLCMLHAFPFLEQSVAPLVKTQAGESAAYAVLLAAGPRGAAPPQVLAKLAVAAATRNDLLMSNFAAEVRRS
ncbi:unnamed protein product [Effrenium voratum]|nr:unnamed protein product [Effrenium voratum]